MNKDEWFFTRSIYKKSTGVYIPLKQGYAKRNIISAANKAPEVMVKIPRRTVDSKGLKGIKNHWDYITRNGELELITDDGEIIKGKDELKNLLNYWKFLGIPKESKRRENLNIVLSMPPGTCSKALLNSVKELAKEQFVNHKYVMALHTDELHPHVHLCLMIKNNLGKRLNPRKADIQEWRIRFADKLRENGISCSATFRQHRGIYQKKENSIVRNIKDRGGNSTIESKRKENLDFYIKNGIIPTVPFLDKAKQTREKIIGDYVKFANSLKQEGDLKSYNVVINFIDDLKNNSFISKEKEKYLSYNKNINLDKGLDI